MKKVFVSGQLDDLTAVHEAYKLLKEAGHVITHDWTVSDAFLSGREAKLKDKGGSGVRAKQDIQGVLDCDAYILLSDNKKMGKGMYVELGAALALNASNGIPEIYIVGEMNYMSVFYLHPAVKHRKSIDEVVKDIS